MMNHSFWNSPVSRTIVCKCWECFTLTVVPRMGPSWQHWRHSHRPSERGSNLCHWITFTTVDDSVIADTPQFRGGNPYFFSENPYQSVSFICINVSRKGKRSRDSYHDAVFCQKIATLCNKNRHPAAKNQNRSFTSRGATVGLGLRLWLTSWIVLHRRRRNLPFFGNLAEKASCVDDKTVLFRYTYS